MSKKALRLPTILIFSMLALYSCVMVPLRQFLATDIVWNESVWFALVDLLWMHLEIVISVALLTFVVYGVYRYRLSGIKDVVKISAAALLFKYVAAIIAFSIEFGSIDLTGELTSFLVGFLIDLALIALALFLTHRFVTPHQLDYEAKLAAAQTLGRTFEEKPIYPFQKIFSLKNPLQRLLFLCAANVGLWRLLADIPETFRYGFFDATDILVAFISWFILFIIPACYSYFLSLAFFKLCNRQDAKYTLV